MTRRFDIGPVVLALGALAAPGRPVPGLVRRVQRVGTCSRSPTCCSPRWPSPASSPPSGLITPDVDYVDRRVRAVDRRRRVRRWSPRSCSNPPPVASEQDLGTGAWLALAGTVVMVVGARAELHQGLLRRRGRGARPAPARRRRRPPAAADRDRRARRALEHLAPASAAERSHARGRRAELMPAAGDVSFELERFEWTADDRLEVVGRWNGVRGRRLLRPALTVDAGGRRQRVTGTPGVRGPVARVVRLGRGARGHRGRRARDRPHAGRRAAAAAPAAPPAAQATAESDLRAAWPS